MSDLRAAARQALEALEAMNPYPASKEEIRNASITALRAALEQPEQEQKPVALPCCGYIDASAIKWNPFNGVVQCHNCGQTYTALRAALEQSKPVEVMDAPLLLNGQPLYTHPPIERTLTDEKIADLWHQNGGFHHHFARAVERYLKGKK